MSVGATLRGMLMLYEAEPWAGTWSATVRPSKQVIAYRCIHFEVSGKAHYTCSEVTL